MAEQNLLYSMLAVEHRLKKAKDFQSVFDVGRGVREDGLFFKVQKGKGGTSRVGIVVSKKVSKKAVERNRIRRIIQEQMRKQVGEVKYGIDGVIVVLPEFKETTPQALAHVIPTLFTKASILK